MTSNEPLIELPFLCHIGLVITYKCQVACPHCLLEAGPQRTEEMQLRFGLDGTASHICRRPYQAALAHRWGAVL